MEHLDPQIDTCSPDTKKKVLLCVCKLSVLITYIKIMMYGSTTSSSGNSLCTWTHPIVASKLRDDRSHFLTRDKLLCD